MDRHWLLTNTCYGNWLPGNERGFVGRVWEHREDDPQTQRRVLHHLPGTEFDRGLRGLRAASAELLSGPPIVLSVEHAETLLAQFQETAGVRRWRLVAVAILFNHFHIIVAVPGDPRPGKILGDFKSWGTRRLSERYGAPRSETWWTERGSKRKLPNERAVHAARHYVLHEQPRPLITWSPETGLCYGIPPRSD